MCQRDLTRFLRYTGQALLRMLYTSTHEKCVIENCYHHKIYAFNFETQFRNKPIISSKAPTHAVICPLYVNICVQTEFWSDPPLPLGLLYQNTSIDS